MQRLERQSAKRLVRSHREFADRPLKEDAALAEKLKINKEDIRLFRLYNMYPVM